MSTPPLYLTEADVARLVTMKDAIETTTEAFAAWRDPRTTNLPRRRAPLHPGALNLMGATYGAKGVLGHKAYFGGHGGSVTHFTLYSITEGRLMAVIESDLLGQLRTGAASGIATRALALPDARRSWRSARCGRSRRCGCSVELRTSARPSRARWKRSSAFRSSPAPRPRPA